MREGGGVLMVDDGNDSPPAEQQRRLQAAAYQGAMEAVFSIVICVGFGYWADSHFETTPRYLLIGAAVGFGAFVLRIMRMRPTGDAAPSPETGARGGENSSSTHPPRSRPPEPPG